MTRTLPNPATEPTINVRRVAAILGISERHAYACIHSGDIPSVPVGKRIVIPTARFLAKYQLVDEAEPVTDAAADAA